jgi:hypothetical protein
LATELTDISLQSTASHISLSLGKSYLSAASNNFAVNVSNTDITEVELEAESSSSSIRSSLYMKCSKAWTIDMQEDIKKHGRKILFPSIVGHTYIYYEWPLYIWYPNISWFYRYQNSFHSLNFISACFWDKHYIVNKHNVLHTYFMTHFFTIPYKSHKFHQKHLREGNGQIKIFSCHFWSSAPFSSKHFLRSNQRASELHGVTLMKLLCVFLLQRLGKIPWLINSRTEKLVCFGTLLFQRIPCSPILMFIKLSSFVTQK